MYFHTLNISIKCARVSRTFFQTGAPRLTCRLSLVPCPEGPAQLCPSPYHHPGPSRILSRLPRGPGVWFYSPEHQVLRRHTQTEVDVLETIFRMRQACSVGQGASPDGWEGPRRRDCAAAASILHRAGAGSPLCPSGPRAPQKRSDYFISGPVDWVPFPALSQLGKPRRFKI